MKLPALLAAFLLASSASAQTRAAATAVLPGTGVAVPAFGLAPVPNMFAGLALTPAPGSPLSLTAAVPVPMPLLVPSALRIIPPAASTPAPLKVAALTGDVEKIVAGLGDKPSGDASLTAGRDIEALLTGAALSAPSVADETATPAELTHVTGASASLAARADDLGAAKGLKAGTMSGSDFLGLLEEAARTSPPAPTPAAAEAALEVSRQVVRFARALIPAGKPLAESLSRALAVWQVFDQEMAIAASKGTLEAIVADAKLFASQVEDSVAPALAPAPARTLETATPAVNEHPEDPNGLKTITEPGSVFGWQPIAQSPGHGLPMVDALIRRVLAEKKSGYPEGFTLPGSAQPEAARVHFYGERHTDGQLISANMKRLVSDARTGKPMIVLVESYVGWTLRGWSAVKYLADRGLDPDALIEKGVAIADLEVRGWDSPDHYQASQHPMLQHHMDLLELNRLAHGTERGWRYYRDFARAALTAWRSYREVWRVAIVARNGDLDRAVAKAAAEADETGATVHVIAGTDHLMQNPRVAGLPLIGRLTLRRSLRAALGGRPFRASPPPNTQG